MSNLPINPKTLANQFWENLEGQDFSPPIVSIGQPTTKVGMAGAFNFNNGNSVVKLETIKLIVPTKTRVLYNGRNASRCRSDNFHEPSQSIADPPSPNCLICPMQAWGKNEYKDAMAKETKPFSYNPEKPLCNETYNLLLADKDWNLFYLGLQKTQLKVAKDKLFSRLRYGFGTMPPFHVGFDMSLVKEGAYYQIVFDNFKEIDDKDVGSDLYARWKNKAAENLARQHDQQDKSKEKDVTAKDVLGDEEAPF